MAKCRLCEEKKIGMIKIEPIGYICSGCIVALIEKLTMALDSLYDKFIYPMESKYILENLANKDFDLKEHMENNKYFSEEIMFEVVGDILENGTDEIEALILEKVDIKKVIMEFDENDKGK